jgi:hypothetical protein
VSLVHLYPSFADSASYINKGVHDAEAIPNPRRRRRCARHDDRRRQRRHARRRRAAARRSRHEHGRPWLNADQEKLWQNALDTMKQNHTAMRESHKQMREQFKSMAQQPILDLNAMHAAHQKIEEQNAQLREQTATAWLNFYNSLNDQQKTTVSSALKKHFAKMHEHEQKMHERWSNHRGAPGEGAASGAAPTTKP